MLQFSETGVPELLKAFVAAQGEMDGAKKNAANPAFKSKYADLGAVCDAVMEALNSAKIAVIQAPEYTEEGVTVQTILAHEGGGMMWNTLTLRPQQQTPQGVGSAITYARRYALAAICGVAPEDDDGNAASNITGAPKVAATRNAPQQEAPETMLEKAKTKFAEAQTLDDLNTRMDWFSKRVAPNEKAPLADLFDEHLKRFPPQPATQEAA